MGKAKRPLTTYTLAEANGRIDRFIEAYSQRGIVGEACKAAGISRDTAYKWRKKYRTFAERWDQAREDAIDRLEGIAHGIAEGDERQPPDKGMVKWLLAANRRSKYAPPKEVNQNVTGDVSGEFVIRFTGRKVNDE